MAWPEYPFRAEWVSTGSWFDPSAEHRTKTGVGDYFPAKEETDVFRRVGLDSVTPSWEAVKGLLLAARIPAKDLQKLSVPAIVAILSQLPATQEVSRGFDTSKEPDSEAEAPKTRLSKDDVEAVVRASLLRHHGYADGEIGEYAPLAAKAIVDQILEQKDAKPNTAASAVSRAFERLFSSTKGHAEYVKHCRSPELLRNWCIRQAGDERAFAIGTLDAGELASESELQKRVAFRE